MSASLSVSLSAATDGAGDASPGRLLGGCLAVGDWKGVALTATAGVPKPIKEALRLAKSASESAPESGEIGRAHV